MKVYNYKYHIVLSVIISCFIGIVSFLIVKPTQLHASKGVIESVDNPSFIHTQISYGYDSIFTITIISLFFLLVIYKPVKKIIKNKL